jgi:hypothetical protein
LEQLAAEDHLGVARLGGESLALPRQAQLVGGQREEPRLLPGRPAAAVRPARADGAELLAVGLDPDPVHVVPRLAPRSIASGVRAVSDDPSSGFRCRLAGEDRLERRSIRLGPLAGVDLHDLASSRRPRDPDPVHRRPVEQDSGDRRQRHRRRRRGRQRPTDAEQGGRLVEAPLCLGRPVGLLAGEPADRDADGQEQDEIDPLARVDDGQREPRLDEQDVVEEERDHRDHDARACPVGGPDDDRDEVDGGRVRDVERRCLDEGDRDRREGERRTDRGDASDRRGGPGARQRPTTARALLDRRVPVRRRSCVHGGHPTPPPSCASQERRRRWPASVVRFPPTGRPTWRRSSPAPPTEPARPSPRAKGEAP